jgi:hypothetical protein
MLRLARILFWLEMEKLLGEIVEYGRQGRVHGRIDGGKRSIWLESCDQGWTSNTCQMSGLDKACILTGSAEERDLQKSRFPLVWDPASGRPPEQYYIYLRYHARLAS